MDIAFLTTALDRGGAETQMVRLATTLRRRGWRVGILTMLPSSAFRDDLVSAEIPWVECLNARDRIPWRSAVRIVRQLRRWRPVVLVTFNFPADVFGRICGRFAGVPAIVSAVGTTHIRTSLRRKFYRLTEPLIAVTVANSKAAAAAMTARGILSPAKTRVIPNGLSLEAFEGLPSREEIRAGLHVRETDFLWLAVGNLRPAKDYPNLLKAAARCATVSGSFRLLVAGAAQPGTGRNARALPYAEALRLRAAELRLEGQVEFLGERDDVPQLLRAADGFVLSSAWEGMPNAVMEAMAAALPVVATDVGDVPELVEDRTSGFVVQPGDSEALADRMLSLMAMPPDQRRAMGERGLERIRARFENERVVDEWEALFRRLVNRNVPDHILPVQHAPAP
jgi:glycosyltransferase involved in cell wall biosynthesis